MCQRASTVGWLVLRWDATDAASQPTRVVLQMLHFAKGLFGVFSAEFLQLNEHCIVPLLPCGCYSPSHGPGFVLAEVWTQIFVLRRTHKGDNVFSTAG